MSSSDAWPKLTHECTKPHFTKLAEYPFQRAVRCGAQVSKKSFEVEKTLVDERGHAVTQKFTRSGWFCDNGHPQ